MFSDSRFASLRQRRLEPRSLDASSKGMTNSPEGRKFALNWFIKPVVYVIVILYIVIPVAFYLSPVLRRHAIFLNYVSFSGNRNLSQPTDVGLNCTKSFFIPSDEHINLGVWHIPPADAIKRCPHGVLLENEEFADSKPVFLYLHGNAGSRGGGHRVQLYKVLSEKVNAHVVAFDYRGYGDSTNVSPSADGLVKDTSHVYHWLKQRIETSRIYIWGHSLGTGVGVAFLESLSESGDIPAGLILEAPFTKLADVAKHHPLSFLHRHMPFFNFFFADRIGERETEFNSLDRIGRVKSPLLILHAEDDGFVPYEHGKALYEKALSERPSNLVAEFVGFESKLNYGHKFICEDSTLPSIIKRFIQNLNEQRIKH